MELAKKLQSAGEAHIKGNVGEAERLYREILEDAPREAMSLHYLGLILYQRGEFAASADLNPTAVDAAAARAVEIARASASVKREDVRLAPEPAAVASISTRCVLVRGSSPAVGSSSNNTWGSMASTAAKATLRFSPTLS